MITTYNEILKFNPCRSGIDKAPKEWIDSPSMKIDFKNILKIVGVKDTFWCLRTQKYKDICLILADVAESVLYLFETKHPKETLIRKCITGIREYHDGKISITELKKLRAATAAYADAYAAYDYTYTADACADAAAYAAAYAAYTAEAYIAAYAADAAAAYTAAYAADDYTSTQWEISKSILEKYL